MFGKKGVLLGVSKDDEKTLSLTLGPCNECTLSFSPTSFALVNHSCSEVAKAIPMNSWARAKEGEKLAALGEGCTVAEYIMPPEIADAGISAKNGTVAFPWGCGAVPLPDGVSVFVVTNKMEEGGSALVAIGGEAAWRDG